MNTVVNGLGDYSRCRVDNDDDDDEDRRYDGRPAGRVSLSSLPASLFKRSSDLDSESESDIWTFWPQADEPFGLTCHTSFMIIGQDTLIHR